MIVVLLGPRCMKEFIKAEVNLMFHGFISVGMGRITSAPVTGSKSVLKSSVMRFVTSPSVTNPALTVNPKKSPIPMTKLGLFKSAAGKFEGIGARLSKRNQQIKVVEIISGGPVWRQENLEVGDAILKVRQEDQLEAIDISGMVIDEAVKLIKGPKGTKVFLTIKRVEGNIEEISITRDVVELEETYAKSTLIKDISGDYGLIELPKFYINFENYNERNAAIDVKKELQQLKQKNVKGIILDLRNNGGGSLKTVVDMTGYFIDKGPVVQVKSTGGRKEVLKDVDPSERRRRAKQMRETLMKMFDDAVATDPKPPEEEEGSKKQGNIFNRSFIDPCYKSGGTKTMQKRSTQYVDYQRRSQAFELGMRVYPFLGGNPARSGIVVAVFPAIGMVDVQFPHGSMRYPVEELVVDTSGDYLNIYSDDLDTIPGGVGTVPVSSRAVKKQANRVASRYMKQAIEYKPIFLVTISAVFFLLTRPASSIVNPAAIHMTSAAVISIYNVFNAYSTSIVPPI